MIASTLDSMAIQDGNGKFYFPRNIQVQICDHVKCLVKDAGLFSTVDVITNHEWYHRLFKLLSHFRGACYRIAGDHLLGYGSQGSQVGR